MFRPKLRNHAFERMGEGFAPRIDYDHFLGRSAFDVPYDEKKEEEVTETPKKEKRKRKFDE
jgi:hypothetical protein